MARPLSAKVALWSRWIGPPQYWPTALGAALGFVAAAVVAVPVGARQAVQALRSVADFVVCLSMPEPFIAVGGAYEDFRQLSDEEVLSILEEYSS